MNPNLIENNYVYIPQFINPERAKLLANNFENFCKENNLGGDEQIPESHSEYNYIDFLELLCNSTPEVSNFIGENVLPTYTYSRVYRQGAELKIHKDRDACEISLTVHLDGDKDWPIFIKNPKGESVKLNLKSGDAMIYLGCDAEHWREMYEGDRYVQVFLHYVRSRGDKSYAYFDKIQNKNNKVSNTSKNTQLESENTIDAYKTTASSKLIDYIQIFDNVIPHKLCDEIIQEYSNCSYLDYARVGAQGILETSVRNVITVLMSDPNVMEINYEKRKNIDNEIYKCMGDVIKKYTLLHPNVNIVEDSGYTFLKYEVGNFYKQHTDTFKQEPRLVSCSIALNDIDEYEGGEFCFFDKELKYKIKKGSVLMFPSNFMYPHEILPVTKGTRYSIITWFV